MNKLFQVEEAKLAAFVDAALKTGGLALHGAAAALLNSLKDVTPSPAPTPAQVVSPSEVTKG